jgi:hypothetical protein
MSFLSKLVLDSNEYNILTVEYEVSQPIGRRNMPTDEPHLGLIQLTVESSNKSELFAWAMAPRTTKNGSIVFYRRDAQSSMKTLNFSDTFCIQYKEIFEADGAVPMKVKLTLAPRVIECQGVTREESWPGHEGAAASNGSSSGSGASEEKSTVSSDSEISSFIPS